METAYDQLHCNFISDRLVEFGLFSNGVSLIMACVHSSHIQIIWNGELMQFQGNLTKGSSFSLYFCVVYGADITLNNGCSGARGLAWGKSILTRPYGFTSFLC